MRKRRSLRRILRNGLVCMCEIDVFGYFGGSICNEDWRREGEGSYMLSSLSSLSSRA
jgi:hypothetical protein